MRYAMQHASRLATRSSFTRACRRQFPMKIVLTSFSSQEKTFPRQPAYWGAQSKLPLKARAVSLVESDFIRVSDISSRETVELVIECCRLNTLEGMSMAHEILDRLFVEKRRLKLTGKKISVPIDLLQKIMFGWAKLAPTLRVAQIRMKGLLQLAIAEATEDLENSRGDDAPSSQPDTSFFNTYLHGCANAAKISPGIANVARNTLSDMFKLQATHGWHTRPNQRSYTCVMEAYAHSDHPKASVEAVAFLRDMHRHRESELQRYLNDFGEPYDGGKRRRIVSPDAAIYTLALKTFKKHQSKMAIELFKEMEKNQIEPDPILCTAILHSFREILKDENHPKQRLRLASQAERIFRNMMGPLENPTTTSGHENLLIAFNACLGVWSHAFIAESAIRCEEMLKQVLEQQPESVIPNANSFNSCLHAWSESNKFYSDAATRAEKILELQFQLSLDNSTATPDFQSYTFAILAHAKSNNPQKVFEARRLLQQLQVQVRQCKVASSGNISAPFTAVLSACAKTPPLTTTATENRSEEDDSNALFGGDDENDQDLYFLASQTFEGLCEMAKGYGDKKIKDMVPDHFAFGMFLRCLAVHCPEHSVERSTRAKLILDQAAAAGQVSRLVAEGYQAACSDTSTPFLELMQRESIPSSWFRNVPTSFRIQNTRKIP